MKSLPRALLAGAVLLAACTPGAPPPAASAPAAAPATAAAAGSGATESGAYVVLLGTDTLAFERFTRSADRLEGRLVLRTPRLAQYDYVAMLAPDGTVARFESRGGRFGEPPQATATVEFGADTATVRVQQGDSTRTQRIAAPRGTVPLLGNSFALLEQLTRQARAAGQDSASYPALTLGARAVSWLPVRRLGGDSLLVHNIAGANRVHADAAGRLLAWDGRTTTFQLTTRRLRELDFDALAAAFAAREQQGQGMGPLSPRDSLRVSVAGATLSLDYGRPARRGRPVLGNLVRWNEVWRTGANQATILRTDRDLMLGETRVPAGAYSLFTLPTPAGWTLIVNRQTGQWGTEYDRAQDLAHIPMTQTRLAEPLERFTMGIEPRAAGGVLWLAWDTVRAEIPFTVR